MSNIKKAKTYLDGAVFFLEEVADELQEQPDVDDEDSLHAYAIRAEDVTQTVFQFSKRMTALNTRFGEHFRAVCEAAERLEQQD